MDKAALESRKAVIEQNFNALATEETRLRGELETILVQKHQLEGSHQLITELLNTLEPTAEVTTEAAPEPTQAPVSDVAEGEIVTEPSSAEPTPQ